MTHLEKAIGIEYEQPAFLYGGNDTGFMPEVIRHACAVRVSEELASHPYTMLQFSPESIMDAMQQGRSALALGSDGNLAGFAQLWQYGITETGRQILEFGSWLSFQKGLGEKILRRVVVLGGKIDPDAQIVAIVEEENEKAQTTLIRVGGKIIGTKLQPAIRTVAGEAAHMKIFDITEVTI